MSCGPNYWNRLKTCMPANADTRRGGLDLGVAVQVARVIAHKKRCAMHIVLFRRGAAIHRCKFSARRVSPWFVLYFRKDAIALHEENQNPSPTELKELGVFQPILTMLLNFGIGSYFRKDTVAAPLNPERMRESSCAADGERETRSR
eukprot:1544588-Amphidinium_carterae.1